MTSPYGRRSQDGNGDMVRRKHSGLTNSRHWEQGTSKCARSEIYDIKL